MTASVLFVDRYPMAENWVMVVSEMHRYQGVSYKSDIIVVSGNIKLHTLNLHPTLFPTSNQLVILIKEQLRWASTCLLCDLE